MDRAEQRKEDQAEQSDSRTDRQTDGHKPSGEQKVECDLRWGQVLELWSESDTLIEDLITKAKGGTLTKYQKDGTRRRRLEKRWEDMAGTGHVCGKMICEEENRKLLEITRRNLDKLMQPLGRWMPDQRTGCRHEESPQNPTIPQAAHAAAPSRWMPE